MFKFNEKIAFPHKDNDIFTIGELLVDMISTDYNGFKSDTFKKYFGGSPANIAVNTKNLGLNSLMASAIGNDDLGKYLYEVLENFGLNTDYIQVVEHSTSLVLVTKSKQDPVPIFYRGADYHLAYNDALEQAVKNSKIMHFSCWPLSRQPARQTITRLIETAKQNQTLICFDPNYHPMIWEKGENGPELVASIINKVDIVKPSELDAERLFGKDSYENYINKFLELGAKLVILTLGEEGAIISNGTDVITCPSLAEEVTDTTGAGDAFWSGFYTGLIKELPIQEALKLGFATSAFKLKFTGAIADGLSLEKITQIDQTY